MCVHPKEDLESKYDHLECPCGALKADTSVRWGKYRNKWFKGEKAMQKARKELKIK